MRRVSYAALLGLPLTCAAGLWVATPSPAAAEDSFLSLGNVGDYFSFSRQREAYDYTERAPLVVPPTNTLPPPGAAADAAPVSDPDLIARRRALAESRRPVPPSDPGAYAAGLSARAYLVDPPSGLRDPRVVAADITTDKTATASVKPAKHHHVVKRTPAPQETSQAVAQ